MTEPERTWTAEDIEGFARRIAISAREDLEATERAWVYLPSFQEAVTRWGVLILKSVLTCAAQLDQATWRDIATAPKDGTEFVGIDADGDVRRIVFVGHSKTEWSIVGEPCYFFPVLWHSLPPAQPLPEAPHD